MMIVPNHEEPEQHADTEEAHALHQSEQEAKMALRSPESRMRFWSASFESCGGT